MNEKHQSKITKNERIFRDIIIENKIWVDPNTQVLVIGGDEEGTRLAANQIHYKSIRNMKKEEYQDVFGAKSYAEAMVGARRVYNIQGHDNKKEA